jgi:hypothetical protein
VAAEDTLFYEHNGIDTASIEKATRHNLKQSQKSPSKASAKSKKAPKVRGASTITQQLVKNLYLSRERSYLRKAREVSGALALELVASKETILAWYLNVIEFGPNVYGLDAAAQHYFGKPGARLRPHECVSLAVILPSPNKWNTSLTTKRYSSFFERRYSVIARRMGILGHLNATAMREVRSGAPFFFEAPREDGVEAAAIPFDVPPAPEVSDVPEAPEAPEVPEVPEVPEAQEVPEVPEAVEVPEAQEVPEVPEASEVELTPADGQEAHAEDEEARADQEPEALP